MRTSIGYSMALSALLVCGNATCDNSGPPGPNYPPIYGSQNPDSQKPIVGSCPWYGCYGGYCSCINVQGEYHTHSGNSYTLSWHTTAACHYYAVPFSPLPDYCYHQGLTFAGYGTPVAANWICPYHQQHTPDYTPANLVYNDRGSVNYVSSMPRLGGHGIGYSGWLPGGYSSYIMRWSENLSYFYYEMTGPANYYVSGDLIDCEK